MEVNWRWINGGMEGRVFLYPDDRGKDVKQRILENTNWPYGTDMAEVLPSEPEVFISHGDQRVGDDQLIAEHDVGPDAELMFRTDDDQIALSKAERERRRQVELHIEESGQIGA